MLEDRHRLLLAQEFSDAHIQTTKAGKREKKLKDAF